MTWPPCCVADTRGASASPESLCEQRRERLAAGDQLAAVVMRDQAVGGLWRAESRKGAMTRLGDDGQEFREDPVGAGARSRRWTGQVPSPAECAVQSWPLWPGEGAMSPRFGNWRSHDSGLGSP